MPSALLSDPGPAASSEGAASRADAIGMLLAFCGLVIWLVVSVLEGNLAIFAAHLLFLVASAIVLRIMNMPTATRLFYAALLIRSVFTILAWYLAYNMNRRFMVGTNEDASRFWQASLMPLRDATVSFADPLFPALASYLAEFGRLIDRPDYLASCQLVVFAGSFFVVFGYVFVRDLYGENVGRLTGWMLALSPIMIVYSTGLMRDVFIGMFGFLMLLSLNRLLMPGPALRKFGYFLLIPASAYALSQLRTVSLLGFAMAAFFLVMAGTPNRKTFLSRKARAWIIAGIILTGTVGAMARFDRIATLFVYSEVARAGFDVGGEMLNEDGVTTRIARISPLLMGAIAPLALMQPVPFYAWDPPSRMGGPAAPMDILQGLGALMNQLLFAFYIIAIRYWWKTRDYLGICLGVIYVMATCALVLIGLGQIRMVMEQCYPIFFAGISLAMMEALAGQLRSILATIVTWGAALAGLYAIYLGMRDPDLIMLVLVGLVMAAAGLQAIWRAGRTAFAAGEGSGTA